MRVLDPVEVARLFLYVREAQSQGQNRGLRVESIQHWSGGQTADSWCMEFVWFVFDIAYHGECPFDREQSVQSFREEAFRRGWIVDDPDVGDLVLSVDAANHAHHIGLLTDLDPLTSVAGNTSEDGSSDNGDRVAEHAISPAQKVYVRVPE